MPIMCHPDKWWDWCMSDAEKKEIDLMLMVDSIPIAVLEHFIS